MKVFAALLLPGCLLLAQGKPQDNRALRPQQDRITSMPAEPRVALVIGNGAYRSAPLRNPVQDAQGMAGALRTCGFQVTLLEDASRARMFAALREFGLAIQGGGVGLFYFAGHGMQVKGKNYLVPVDSDLASEDEVAYSTLDAEAVLAKMESARNRLNILILDACRNNPFGRSFRSSTQGLAQMDAPAGSYIAFATAPGHTAADGTGTHGLYTQYLLEHLKKPGLKVEDVFKRVRADVMKDSRSDQVPWESSSITGDFYFVPDAPAVSEAPPAIANLADGEPISGEDLLQKAIRARGGLTGLKGIMTMTLRGKAKGPGGPTPFREDRGPSGLFRREQELPEGRLVLAIKNGKVSATVLHADNSPVLPPPPVLGYLKKDKELAAGMLGMYPLLDDPMRLCAEGLGKASFEPWEEGSVHSQTIEGEKSFTLSLQLADGILVRYGLHPRTLLPMTCTVRKTLGPNPGETYVELQDYRKVGDLLLPFSVGTEGKPIYELEEILLNPVFPEDHFVIANAPVARNRRK